MDQQQAGPAQPYQAQPAGPAEADIVRHGNRCCTDGADIKLGYKVEEFGGLHVIATERHESRRIDRQLFGRAGRQGDPGSASTFISMHDELVDRYTPFLLKPLRARYRHARGEITSKRSRRLLERCQQKATHQSASQRKSVLRTDDWLDESLGFAGREL